jgi:hypothetical protein
LSSVSLTERLAKDPDEMVFGDADSGGDRLDGERIPAVAHHEIDRTHHGTGQWTPSHSVGVQELADVVGVNGLGDVAAPSGLVTVIDPGRGARGDGRGDPVRRGSVQATRWRDRSTTCPPGEVLAKDTKVAGRIRLTSPAHRP